MKTRTQIWLILALSGIFPSMAKENPQLNKNSHKSLVLKTTATCTVTTAQFDLDINNVRARILNGGDLWWNYNDNTKNGYRRIFSKKIKP